MPERVSACLIVQNEHERLSAALASVGFCDEVVVVDGGSTDGTPEVARATGARVIENPWPGFAAQRNVALDAATGEWVLELDADERVSSQLRASIEALLAAPPPDVKIAVCARRNRFLGRLLGPSAKYPEYRSRLFRRERYRHEESRTVHEGIEPRERPAILDGDLEHELAGTLREALLDAWRYARLESRHVPGRRDARAYAFGIALRPVAKVAYRVIVDAGWRDGWRGFLKILLDAGSDSLVWALVLMRALGTARATGPQPQAQELAPGASSRHFGRRPAGAPKVVAIAGRGGAADAARDWLAALQRGGADVALVSDDLTTAGSGGDPLGGSGEIAERRVPRLRPLAIMRALDVEMQIRTVHAVVPFGPRAGLLCQLLPRTLRPEIPGVDAHTDPGAAVECLRELASG